MVSASRLEARRDGCACYFCSAAGLTKVYRRGGAIVVVVGGRGVQCEGAGALLWTCAFIGDQPSFGGPCVGFFRDGVRYLG